MLIIKNKTGTTISYPSENVTIAPNSQVTLTSPQIMQASLDGSIISDLDQSNTVLNNGSGDIVGGAAVDFLYDQATMTSSIDKSGSGPVSALGGAVIASVNNNSILVFKITGTWSGSLNLQGSIDGSNWDSIQGYVPSSGNWTNASTSNLLAVVPCGGFTQVQWVATAWSSGTATIKYNASLGNNATQVFSSSAAAFSAQVRNQDINGSGITSQVLATKQALDVAANPVDGSKATYCASTTGVTTATTATDVFTLTGSATKTIRVMRIGLSGTCTLTTTTPVLLIKRSAANSGGTSAAVIAVSNDSTNVAATATVKSYTANPTSLGATVGTMVSKRISIPASGSLLPTEVDLFDASLPAQAIVVRGTSEVIAINFNSTTVGGSSISFFIEWTEE